MDNKQDRNFYWNIKDFMSKPHNPVSPQINTKSIKESINGVLNQNAAYQTTNFQSNITSARHISQAISAVERNNQKGTPDNIGNTKNITSNPFGVVNEGIFDDIVGGFKDYGNAFVNGVKGVAEWGHGNALGSNETSGYAPSKEPFTQAQSSQNNINVKNMAAKTLTPEQQKFEQSTSVPTAGDPNDPGNDSDGNDSDGNDSDGTDIRGDQEDRVTPKVTPAGTPPPPPPPSDNASTPSKSQTSDDTDDTADLLTAQRNANSMHVSTATYDRKATGSRDNRQQRAAENKAKNAALSAANIAIRGKREAMQDDYQKAKKSGASQSDLADKIANMKKFNDRSGYNKEPTQFGNSNASRAGSFTSQNRTPATPTGTTPAPAGTPPAPATPAEQPQPGFDPSKKQVSNRDGTIRTINPTPAPAGTIPTPAAAEEPTQPGFDPSKKQVSNRDGTIRTIEPTQAPATTKEPAPGRAIDNLGMGSLPNNSGGLQNAEQPQPGFDPSKKQYSTKDGKIQTVNSKIAKITAAPKTALA